MNACCLFAWWGFNSWIPAYLSLPPAQGGMGLDPRAMAWLVVFMQVGMWFGYVTFGAVADAFGRKRTYVTYLLMAAAAAGAVRAGPVPVGPAAARAVRRVLRHRATSRGSAS